MKKIFTALLVLMLTLASINSGAVYAAKDLVLDTSVQVETLAFEDVMTAKGGEITHSETYGRRGGATWSTTNSAGFDTYYFGSQFFKGEFTAAVNKGSFITRDNVKYYKINNTENVEAYVAIKQQIYDNEAGGDAKDYYIPYKQDNNSYANMKYKCYASMNYCDENSCSAESNAGDTTSCSGGNVKLIQASTISGRTGTIYFYLPRIPTKSLIFNNTLIAQTRVASGFSTVSRVDADNKAFVSVDSGKVAFEFILNATLTFNNTCSVGSAAVAEIPLDTLTPDSFTTKEGKPSGYTPKRTDLVFSCEKNIADTFTGMNWTITPTADSDGSGLPGVLRAKAKGSNTVNDLGIKVTKDPGGNTAVNFGTANSATIDGNKATATFWAYPTMTSDTKPSGGGDFIATATVTFEVP